MNRPSDAIREYETYLKQSPNAFNRMEIEKRLKALKRQAPDEQSNQ
jgi:hypothetical protein